MSGLCISCIHLDMGKDSENGAYRYCDVDGERHYLCRFYFSERRYCSLRRQGYPKEYIEDEILGKLL